MTQYMIKTTKQEADDIDKGRTVIFRDNKCPYHIGDEIAFIVINNNRIVRHVINGNKYQIVYIAKGDDTNGLANAPLDKGFMAINFRRCDVHKA